MSQISSIFGTDNDEEIMTALYTIVNVSTLSFIPSGLFSLSIIT